MATTTEQPRRCNLPSNRGRTRTTRPVVVDPARLAMAVEAGVFDGEEAAAFLKFPSLNAFHMSLRRFDVKGLRLGNRHVYSRETLDALRRMIFGMPPVAKEKQA
jgi:hypothetical protein